MDFYVTIGDIKDTIHTYWNDHHTSSKFPEILHILYENKKYLDYEPVLPDIGALARLDDDSFLCDRAEEVPDSIRYKISRYLRHISGFILCSWDVAPDRFGNTSLGLSHGSTPDFPGNHH